MLVVDISRLLAVGRVPDIRPEGVLVKLTEARQEDLLIGFIKKIEGTCKPKLNKRGRNPRMNTNCLVIN